MYKKEAEMLNIIILISIFIMLGNAIILIKRFVFGVKLEFIDYCVLLSLPIAIINFIHACSGTS